MIKKMVKKEIDKRLYKQETENLKNNIGKTNEKNEEFNRSKKSDDSMSWRKKSDNNEQDELGYGYNNNYGKKEDKDLRVILMNIREMIIIIIIIKNIIKIMIIKKM